MREDLYAVGEATPVDSVESVKDVTDSQEEALIALRNILQSLKNVPAMGVDSDDHETLAQFYWQVHSIVNALENDLEDKGASE